MHGALSCCLRIAAALLLSFVSCGCSDRDSNLKALRKGQENQPEEVRGAKPLAAEQKIQPADDAKTILSKALAAHGGADKVARWSKGYLKYYEMLPSMPQAGAPIMEDTFDLPGHFKRIIHMQKGTEKYDIVNVHNFGAGWVKYGTAEAEPNKNHFTDRTEHTFAALCDFSKFCTENNERTRMSDEKFDDRDAAVIKVKTPEGFSTNLFIDKQTSLLIGIRKQEAPPGSTTPIRKVFIFQKHKTIQGGIYPTWMKALQDDKVVIYVTILEMKFLDKVDEAEFKKP